MSQRAGWIAAAILLTTTVGVFFWWRGVESRQQTPPPSIPPPVLVTTEGETRSVELYFPGEGGRLYPERRDVAVSPILGDQLTLLVQALLSGPQSEGLRPPFPDGTTVSKVYLRDGDAYVDLVSPDGGSPPSSGSQREMLVVYSLVDSLVLNFDQVRRVVLLWNGNQPLTFGGHLDTGLPLVANPDLIAR